MVSWFSDKVGATKVRDACLRAFDRGEPIGLDTEFYNVDIGKQSTPARARLHFLSVAVKRSPRVITPRGYDLADPAVLPASCLPYLQDVFSHPGLKAVHNLPVDAHTLENEGFRLNGGINTLALSRWAWPGRARGDGFTLDSLGSSILGVGKTEDFKTLFREEVEQLRSTFRREEVCECGTKCGRRRTTPGHSRREEVVETVHSRLVWVPVPLETVVPGHALFQRALRYAAQDAVLALGVYDLAVLHVQKTIREYPW